MKAGTLRSLEHQWRGGIADAARIRNAQQVAPFVRTSQRKRRARLVALFTITAGLIVAAVAIGTGVTI